MMAYNPFPISYQPAQVFYPNIQQQAQQTQQQQAPSNSIIWVQGESGAKSYFVAPNTTVQLWDSESQVIYLKSADATGMPSIKTLDYTVRDDSKVIEQSNSDRDTFIHREELNALKDEITALRSELEKVKSMRQKKTVIVEEEDDE